MTYPRELLVDFLAPWWVYAVCLATGAALFTGIGVFAGRGGGWLAWAGLLSLASSYGVTAITRCLIERRTLLEAFDSRTQSWSMLCDGFIALAIVLGGYGRLYLNPQSWFSTSKLWFAASYVIGLVIALTWHQWFDRGNYLKAGGEALLYSPSMLAHNLTTYVVLAGSLVYLAAPVLLSGLWSRSALPWLIIVCYLVWFLGGFHDRAGLEIFLLHDAFNYHTGQPVRWLRLGP